MKQRIILFICLSIVLLLNANQIETESNRIAFPSGIELDGAAAIQSQFDVEDSPYYPRLDFFNMKSSGSLVLLERFKTFQQTTEFTCGPATIVMVLHHFGIDYEFGDRLLYELRANHERPESTLKDLITMLESTGDWEIISTFDLEDPSFIPQELLIESLKAGKPIIIGDDDWGGHWRIIIGYDDMGDDIEANDVLIVADPYDTTDHFQDGYTVIPFQRLYYNWRNSFDPDFTHNLFLIASPSSEQWRNAIAATLENFAYNKEDANFFVRNQEFYDGILEMVEIKVNKNHSKIIYTSNVGTTEEIKRRRFLSLEEDGIYAFIENVNYDKNDPESKEFLRTKTDLPLIPGQTVCTFLLGPDNTFSGFEDRIANYEPMFMDFLLAVKDNYDWVYLSDGKYVVKEDRHDDMWEAYIQRGRKLSSMEMKEIYFILENGLVRECGFWALDNGVEVRHIYNFQFGDVEFIMDN